jgi:type IV secretory pathway VirB2 component (pilin)
MSRFFQGILKFYHRYYAEVTWFVLGVMLIGLSDIIRYADWFNCILYVIVLVGNFAAWYEWKRRN